MQRELEKLDKLLEHRTRLSACVLLARRDAMKFTRLRELLNESDGNLGAHLRKLEEAGYVAVLKEFVERKPVSWYSLTDQGRGALQVHLDALQVLIDEAKEAQKSAVEPQPRS